MRQIRYRRILIFIAVVVFGLGFKVVNHFRSGIIVTAHNTGTKPMRGVVLHVTGNSYPFGDILPGTSATARVSPTSESDLKVEFTDLDGKVQRLDACGYFESGYRGTIRLSIEDGAIEKNEQDIQLW